MTLSSKFFGTCASKSARRILVGDTPGGRRRIDVFRGGIQARRGGGLGRLAIRWRRPEAACATGTGIVHPAFRRATLAYEPLGQGGKIIGIGPPVGLASVRENGGCHE
jgi:hypothetical protein